MQIGFVSQRAVDYRRIRVIRDCECCRAAVQFMLAGENETRRIHSRASACGCSMGPTVRPTWWSSAPPRCRRKFHGPAQGPRKPAGLTLWHATRSC